VLGRDLFEKADRTKGRFRSFLLIALKRFLATAHDAENAQKRIPKEKLVSLDTVASTDFRQAASDFTPEESFDYAWVSALLERILAEVEARCYDDSKAVYWQVFREKVLAPIMEGAESPSLEEICQKYDIETSRVASNMIVTVKRRFQSILRQRLRETVVSDDEVEDELEHISQFLPRLAQPGR
jgi:RNA polymerase sigma-70 factor (ECF subfamily)